MSLSVYVPKRSSLFLDACLPVKRSTSDESASDVEQCRDQLFMRSGYYTAYGLRVETAAAGELNATAAPVRSYKATDRIDSSPFAGALFLEQQS
jgi:hypothetical protein